MLDLSSYDEPKITSSDGANESFITGVSDFLSSSEYYLGTSIAGIGTDHLSNLRIIKDLGGIVRFAGHLGTGVSVLKNTKDVVQGKISNERYGYRMTGTALTALGGTVSGGVGLLIGVCVIGVEHTWDNSLVPFFQDLKHQFYRVEESLSPSNWIKKR